MSKEKPARSQGETSGGGGTVTIANIADATALGKSILLTVDAATLLELISALGSSGDQVLDGKLQLNHQLALKSVEQKDANVIAFYFGEDDGGAPLRQPAQRTAGGFYPLSMKVQYESSINGWPADAVEISLKDYRALMDRQENGQEIVPGDEGMPERVTPAIDHVSETGVQKRALLREAAEITFPLALAVKRGEATADETASLEAWGEYSVLVSRVQPGEEWPEKPE